MGGRATLLDVAVQTKGAVPRACQPVEDTKKRLLDRLGAAIVCNQGEVVLGRNSVVAANSLVARSFPPHSVILANPARLARQFDPAKKVCVG